MKLPKGHSNGSIKNETSKINQYSMLVIVLSNNLFISSVNVLVAEDEDNISTIT